MLNILKLYILSLFSDKDKEIDKKIENIIIDITSEDIIRGIPQSTNSSILNYAFKRNGYDVVCGPSMIKISDDEYYIPEGLSEHWEAWLASPKIKPTEIRYFKCEKLQK